MMKPFSTLLIALFACMGLLPTAALADAPIADGVYHILNATTDGYLGLGDFHNVDPYIYYVTDGEEITEDGCWIVTNTRSGYTFRNQASGDWLVFTYDRVDQFYKYMTITSEAPDDHSQFWNIIEANGTFCIQSVVDTDYYWNLRSGTNMLGTYRGSQGTNWNERFLFNKVEGTPDPGIDPLPTMHEYVDLDLPSGTLWATCNIGADSPEKCGNYFAWGETKQKDNYVDNTYSFYNNGQFDDITKYCLDSDFGTFDGKTELEALDDGATVNWGGDWMMPSKEQFEELVNPEYTTAEWTSQENVYGMKITSKENGNSIFLPGAAFWWGSSSTFDPDDTYSSSGNYWSRSLSQNSGHNSEYAWKLYFSNWGNPRVLVDQRPYGFSIRPVREKDIKFPSDMYTAFSFPKALHVYLNDGRVEAYPLNMVVSHTEQDGKLLIETTDWTYKYNLSDVDSVSTKRPNFPTFDSFKFNNDYNDQLYTTANGEMVGDTVFVTLAAIGKRLTPSFKVEDDDVVVYAGGTLQESKRNRLRYDKDIYYLVTRNGYSILTPEADGKYMMHPYGRCIRVHVEWLTDRAEVPTIYINTEDGLPITSKDYFKNATITIDGHDIFPSMEETAMQIKGRGNSSWGWPKKPYRLKFEEKVKPLGMKKSKSWVLLSNYQTGSLMSNAIGMKAANLMEASAANHIIPVDLYLNGDYQGSYNFTEKVGFSNNSVDLEDESYAAMLELDSYFDEPNGQKFRSAPYDLPVNIKEPDFSDTTKVTFLTLETIETSFNQFLAALYRGKDISQYVDIEQLARFLMVNELICNFELYHPKSTFCYRENFEDNISKFIFGPVWDLDWAFGYEQNRNYFRGNTTSNYWLEMPNMEVIQFIQDLRWNYEPLCELYRELWEQFMQDGLQELLEYVQDYYDFAKNSFILNRTVWGDYTNYEQQVNDATAWLETRTNKIYQDILNDVRPEKPEPVEPIEFANDKIYTITCKRGDLILNYDYQGLAAGQKAWWTVEDYEKQFAIININGNNYLYSPYLKKYLRTGYVEKGGEWIEALGSPIFFSTAHPDGEYLYMMSTLTETGKTLWFNNNGDIVINSWNTPDDGDRWKITEVGEFDPTEALEIAERSMFAVTNRYIWDGEVLGTETQKVVYGSEPPAPSSTWTNAFASPVEPDDMPWQITEETTIDYEIDWHGPFYFSGSETDIYWYNMTIRSDWYVGWQSEEPYYPIADASEETLSSDEYLWAFGGNPYQVKVYNRSTGLGSTLMPDGGNAVMRQGDYSWDLLPNLSASGDGFVLRVPGTSCRCINQFGGSPGPLQFWDDKNSPTDNGSTFRIYESLVDAVTSPRDASKETTTKVLRNGRIYILHGGKTYTPAGVEVEGK